MKSFFKLLILVVIFSILLLNIVACNTKPTKEAEDAVAKTFDELKNLDEISYNNFFSEKDFSSLGLPEDINKVIKKIVDNLEYKIISSKKVDENKVIVKVDITSIKIKSIFDNFMQSIFKMQQEEKEKNLTEDKIIKNIVTLLLENINNSNLETITTTVDINVLKNNNIWEIQIDKNLLDAIYGGIFSFN